MTKKKYIKEFIHALFQANVPLASSYEELTSKNQDHLLVKNNDNTFTFSSRMNRWDFMWEHLLFEVISKT